MADTKVSGLPAVAAFLSTQEFLVNDGGVSRKVTGAQLLAALPQGTVSGGYAQATANQGAITAQVDLTGLTVTVTLLAGRRIRITGVAFPSSTIANDQAELFIMEGATQLTIGVVHMPVGNQADFLIASVILQPSVGAHTYKLAMSRNNGTGTVTANASATIPSYILVEDIGV